MTMVTATNAKLLRELTGMGLMDCKSALEIAGTEEFAGDVVLGVAYVASSGLAVHVKGDRHAWVLSRARDQAIRLREGSAELDQAFPVPSHEDAPGMRS
jgi:hypothetical protein